MGLNLLGPTASAPTSASAADAAPIVNEQLTRELDVVNILTNGTVDNPSTSRPWVQTRIPVLAAPFATTIVMQNGDNPKILLSQALTLDAANLSTSALGVVNGVATLDSETPPKITLSQCPNLGVGFVKGPYGAGASQVATTDTVVTPTLQYQMLGQIPLGTLGTAITFKPMSFATALMIQADSASRGLLEIRIGDQNSTLAWPTTPLTDPTVLSAARTAQRLVSFGYGREAFLDYHPVATRPAGNATGITPSTWTSYGPSANLTLTLWLVAETGTVTVKANHLAVFSAFLFRTQT